jgi:hypothetical protein
MPPVAVLVKVRALHDGQCEEVGVLEVPYKIAYESHVLSAKELKDPWAPEVPLVVSKAKATGRIPFS